MGNKEQKKDEMEKLFADTFLEMPLQFECGGKYFNIYQKSLGKKLLLNRLISLLELDKEILKSNSILEMARICETKKEIVLRIIAISVKRLPRAINDERDNLELMNFFEKYMDTEDMVSLLMYILQDDNEIIEKLKKHLRIDKQQEKKKALYNIKKDGNKNSISAGGVSAYGSILDYFAEKFGWEKSYILWGISYVNLMLMYYDFPESIFLSDDEMKKVPARYRADDGVVIDPSTPEGQEMIRKMNWK